MTVTADAPVETAPEVQADPGLTEIPTPSDGDGPMEEFGEALMAMPAALLLGANTLTTFGATAFAVGGPVGLAATGAALGGSAAAAAMVRRAHRAEQERKDIADGKTPHPKAPGQVKAARQARKEARQMARAARRATTGSRTGGIGSRAGGGRSGGGGGRAGGRASGTGRHGKTGAHRSPKTTSSPTPGIGGKPQPSTGRRNQVGRVGRVAGKAATAAGRPVRSVASRAAATPMGRAVTTPAREGAARTAAAGRAGAGIARRGGSSAGSMGRTAGRRVAGAGRSLAGGVKRAGSSGQAKLGQGTHGVAGSRAGRAASATGRRAASLGRSTAGRMKRAGQVSRAALRGARSAKGGTPRQVAAAVRRAVARQQATHVKQTGQPLSRMAKARRRAVARGIGLAGGTGAAGWKAARGGSRWLGWAARATHARITGRPIPAPPNRQPPPAPEAGDHPPVADTVDDAPTTAPLTNRTATSTGGPMLGNRLEQLSDEMIAAAVGYKPDGMLQWGRDMRTLETVLGNVAQVLRALEHGAEDLPVNKTVLATLGSVAALQQSCSAAAADIHSTFRAVHAAELERLENPRSNEQMWDAAANK